MNNYRQALAIQKSNENRIKKICPNISTKSGIYMFYRYEITTKCYIGQAKHLIERTAKHLTEYDHIAQSLKKYGLYDSEKNKVGWQLRFVECPVNELDNKERTFIQQAIDKGYVLYNITCGGQDIGKFDINQRKASKTYRDGLKQGYQNCKNEMLNYFTKYLTFSIKDNTNKIKERKLQEFKEWLENETIKREKEME